MARRGFGYEEEARWSTGKLVEDSELGCMSFKK